jgi:hypothetical protein
MALPISAAFPEYDGNALKIFEISLDISSYVGARPLATPA